MPLSEQHDNNLGQLCIDRGDWRQDLPLWVKLPLYRCIIVKHQGGSIWIEKDEDKTELSKE